MNAATHTADASTLRRAKKIFALANDKASAEEASSAMAMVQKMMDKFGLTMADLKDDSVEKKFAETSGPSKKTALANWYKWLASSAALMTDTRAVHYHTREGHSMKFQGLEGDSDIAMMTFEYLQEVCDRALKAHKKETGTKGAQVSLDFRRGFSLEVWKRASAIAEARKVQQQEEAAAASAEGGTALVVMKQAMIAGHFTGVRINTRKGRRFSTGRDGSAYGAGQAAGQAAGLNRQVGGRGQARIA